MPRLKLTAEAKKTVIGALRGGADMALAARTVGMTRRGLQKGMERSPAFAEQVREARDFADETIVQRLYDAAKDGNITAMIFWLKNRRPEEWRDRHDFQHKAEVIERKEEYRAFFQDGTAVFTGPVPVSDTASN